MAAFLGASMAGISGRRLSLLPVLALTLLTGACSSLTGDDGLNVFASSKEPVAVAEVSDAGKTDLQKATEYWGKEYQKNPAKLDNALGYAKNLKALGNKSEAFAVMQQAGQIHQQSRELASEYGRLALEMDQTTLAAQLLEFADDPTKPDWKVISARGAANAKLGRNKEAVALLERANLLAPAQQSVMNNLALAYTMTGEAAKAEELLRKAVATEGASAKTRQNLALVLGLQGKYEEATRIGETSLAANDAKANTALLRQIVKLEPKTAPAVPVPAQPFDTLPPTVAEAWAPVVQKVAAEPVKAAPEAAKMEPVQAEPAKASLGWDSQVVSAIDTAAH